MNLEFGELNSRVSAMNAKVLFLIGACGLMTCGILRADGLADNKADKVRRIPSIGIDVPEDTEQKLRKGLADLGQKIEGLKKALAKEPEWLDLLPDVEIYHKAVRYVLDYQEFHRKSEFAVAEQQLQTGMNRADELNQRQASWLKQKGLVVRGYRSKIDDSAQPYGLEIPESYSFEGDAKSRLDFWFHGRGEKLSELSFISQRSRSKGKISPPNGIVLHPYGRYSNANKFAGEVDLFEALDHARKYYRIDEDRILVRGFSMGGAACWQFAVHYADQWAAAQPGAGFSETPDFLRTFQKETLTPTPWEKTLWHWYDCTDWAINLSNCPTIAYSGEIDSQKQAADMMEKAMDKVGLDLVHLIGPGMAHKFHPDTLAEIETRLTSIAEKGRVRVPRAVRLTTWTLKYNRMNWVVIDEMDEHWKKASIEAEWEWPNGIFLKVEGVKSFTLDFAPGECPLDQVHVPVVELNGQGLQVPPVRSDRSWQVHFVKGAKGKWMVGEKEADSILKKRHDLQGPIDDAFMDSFVMVKPTGEAMNAKVGEWVGKEMEHAVTHWRQQFRGDARVVEDVKVDEAMIANSNLVLWGDPSSNAVLKKIIAKLPIGWSKDSVKVGKNTFAGKDHVMVMIFPNPLNPKRYVVLNSGFTYREYDYLNNARQVAKLPDWAVIDVTSPVTSRAPGKVEKAGFFGEKWELK
ncbi:MAG: prolyl oligopeptidase family serine peptidase [Verrucomicrobiales bacterium]|nr:prolyl oligopeptidase family serine peptidase [Verrucomicrobiales bacterium]